MRAAGEVDPIAGIFRAMAAGRTYPTTSSSCFVMSCRDNEQIAEVILFSEGFKEVKQIGRKLVAIFNLSK